MKGYLISAIIGGAVAGSGLFVPNAIHEMTRPDVVDEVRDLFTLENKLEGMEGEVPADLQQQYPFLPDTVPEARRDVSYRLDIMQTGPSPYYNWAYADWPLDLSAGMIVLGGLVLLGTGVTYGVSRFKTQRTSES